MPVDAALLIKRWDRCKSRKANTLNYVQEIADYQCPRKSNITVKRSEGTKQTERQFDSTAEDAGIKLAASMHGALTSPSQKWFSLVPRSEELKNEKIILDWLEECADRLYGAFNQSNFDDEISEVYQDLAFFGTGGLLMEEGVPKSPGAFGGFRFRALDFAEYCVDEDPYGRVDTVYRTFEMTYRALYGRFGESIGHDALEAYKNKPEELCDVLHACYPRQDRDQRKVNGANMPWASCYLLLKGQVKVAEGGFREFPFMIPRWSKSPGELYGRGPGHRAQPDVRSLNRLQELYLEACSKAVDPPLLQMSEAVNGDTTLNPAGINIVDATMAGGNVRNVIAPLESAAKFDVGKDEKAELRAAIRAVYFVDQLQLPDAKPNMTATEATIRQELMQRLLGPTMGRQRSELHRPIVERGFSLMLNAGALPPVPEELAQYAGADIDVLFEGPLARAQRAGDIIAINRVNAYLEQASVFAPEVKDGIDFDEQLKIISEVAGQPSNCLRDKKMIGEMRQKRAVQAQKNAALEQMAMVGEGANKAAPMLKSLPKTAGQLDTALAGAGA